LSDKLGSYAGYLVAIAFFFLYHFYFFPLTVIYGDCHLTAWCVIWKRPRRRGAGGASEMRKIETYVIHLSNAHFCN